VELTSRRAVGSTDHETAGQTDHELTRRRGAGSTDHELTRTVRTTDHELTSSRVELTSRRAVG